jgi:hypothetical protein
MKSESKPMTNGEIAALSQLTVEQLAALEPLEQQRTLNAAIKVARENVSALKARFAAQV